MSLRLLISDSEYEWSEEIKKIALERNYLVEIAQTGKDCQLKVYRDKYFAVVLDVDTRNHSGFEVLKYLRLNAPSVKVVLTFKNEERFKQLDLSVEKLRKLGASDILIKPYPMDMLFKSLEGVNQFNEWKSLKGEGPQKEEESVDADDTDFTRIKIEDFYSGNTTIFDCYVKISNGKYIKILHKGDFFEESRVRKYSEEKQVKHLYFLTSERSIYINFINEILENMIHEPNVKTAKKVNTARNLVDKYIEEIHTVGLRPQLIEEGKKVCQNVYDLIISDPDLMDIMSIYEEFDPPAYAHLFLVAFFASITCQNLDWSSRRTTELIAFGSFLHDVGLLRLSEELKELKYEEMDESQREEFESHPRLGAEMLIRYPTVEEPIRQIVYQHHENMNGTGFPNGLSGSKIYPLAKVVALANDFSSQMIKLQKNPLLTLKEFILDRKRIARFDPAIIKALVEAFVKDS